MSKLNTKERDALPDSDFAVPGKRVMPIQDKDHVEKAWELKDTAHDLTPEEKAEARKRILSRAKELGIDTSKWNLKAAASLIGTSFTAKAVTLENPQDSHPNKIYGTGVLTRLDEPSDAPLGGSNGRRVILPSSVAQAALSTLIGMPLNFSNDFDAHHKGQPIGAISAAAIVGNEIEIKFYLYAVNFPEQVKRIQQEKTLMGFSYELADITCLEVGDDLLEVVTCTFTGAAILYKDKAAYKTTSLDANEEIIMQKEILEKLQQMEDANKSLALKVEELTASNKKLLEANASVAAAVKPAVESLRAGAEAMDAAGVGGDTKRGHAAIARGMANDLEAAAAKGSRPQIYQTEDFLSASADNKKDDEEADKKFKELQASNENLQTQIEDLKKTKFMNASEPNRQTLPPQITALLSKENLMPSNAGEKINVKSLDAAFDSAKMTTDQRLAAKTALRNQNLI